MCVVVCVCVRVCVRALPQVMDEVVEAVDEEHADIMLEVYKQKTMHFASSHSSELNPPCTELAAALHRTAQSSMQRAPRERSSRTGVA